MNERRGDDGGGDREGSGHPPRRRPDLDAPLRSDSLPASVSCPFCGGTETEQFAAFGSAVSTSQYWCRQCRTAFESMKWREG